MWYRKIPDETVRRRASCLPGSRRHDEARQQELALSNSALIEGYRCHLPGTGIS
jgi:hypothetical protein